MEKIRLDRPVLVEGKYDKIAVEAVADTTVIALGGFGIFSRKEKQLLIRRIAERTGVIVLTDPDSAGRVIRGFLSQILPPSCVIHLYIPAIAGKEKRKETASRAGLLGVEGMDAGKLREILSPFAVDADKACTDTKKTPVTKMDFFTWGLSGGNGSKEKRDRFARALSLPPEMSANSLLAAVNLLYSREECERAVGEI